MTSGINEQIAGILKDESRSKEDRISELLTMREDARALQRAGTESPMVNEDQTSSGLREIDVALEKLGHNSLQDADEKSAATL
ncbi:hypothetical protein [Roseibium marinum]|uniref:Uncharacterized protein n=1 Tax=Roseibium marinum TaxID=281252 RepID=A0A2S3URU0_9HYPH|nr:hypothetical protein [Roseibium marinum]POF30442.1 hypothetical protein CLV41_10654 [Roseibium marinum]